MTKRQLLTALIITLLLLAISSLLLADSISKEDNTSTVAVSTVIEVTLTPTLTNSPTPSPTPTPTPIPNILNYIDIGEVKITGYRLELTSLGRHYITAYDPYECGYNGSNYPNGWVTASDAICHRASYDNRYLDYTTCAIDRNIYKFGTLFYIPEFDRVFIAQDTGGAVKGKHLDLFYESHSDVISFPTGNYTVYSVNIVEFETTIKEYNGIELVYN